MIDVSFANPGTLSTAGLEHLVVVAPASRAAKGPLPRGLLDKKRTELVRELAARTKPGRRGALGSTLAGGPTWLHLAVLPDAVSRYNAPSRADSVRFALAGLPWGAKGKALVVLLLDDPAHLLAAANAVSRAIPAYTAKADPAKVKVAIAAFGPDGQPVVADARTKLTVRCAREAAILVDTPPSELHPTALAAAARAALGDGVTVTEYVGDELAARGLGGIFGVGKAAVEPPRLLIAQVGPADAARHVALVGKGITFDTGGLHLKQRGFMEGMKADMGGAAAVLGAFRVLAAERPSYRLSLVLAIAENAIAAGSYKPDDILRMHSGKTVEINNTDAEGRLLLGDGVSWAARELGADLIIDAATLTGAQLIATGVIHAAVVSDDGDLEAHAVAAGRATGDLCHPLPFAPELYAHEFKSPVADLRNSVADRNNAQSSCAAQFVYEHLSGAAAGRRWCHVDLAGPAFPKDCATGYGVALLAELVRRAG
ncbi:MAG: leucyl aminopeptidase family protein [Kofleriaceae bacterium]|nr:leucyl aminopeptidase family protein [Kofleriaceae bacterium]MBP9166409.1 leucyl aminopeptidase family protein [Kofleriaceae bacterium]MBP9858650.1 leucyl aminopeptidase family protein [Kofleriaceae bacterium]